jgi:probable H4MPT-linked C1 transfer pathway protein
MTSHVLGLDIGGANLKAAGSDGIAKAVPFELWRRPAELPAALGELLKLVPAYDGLAVTMTAELCDCYETKRAGVNAVLDAVEAVADGLPVSVWRCDGRFGSVAEARAEPLLAAASNWLATATLAARQAPRGPALLIDVGGTTTDIIPLLDGRPIPRGRTDPARLASGELVYAGARRTPVCALLRSVALSIGECGVAAELFATTHDAYLALGRAAPDPEDIFTADGRPATAAFARDRLARVICGDRDTVPPADIDRIARAVADAQAALVRSAVQRVAATLPSPPTAAIICGSGEFLAADVLASGVLGVGPLRVIRLSESLGPELSAVAPAYAVAVLAAEVGR